MKSLRNTTTLAGNIVFIAGLLKDYKAAQRIVDIIDTAVEITKWAIRDDTGIGDYDAFMLLVEKYLTNSLGDRYSWAHILILESHGLSIRELRVDGILTGIRIVHMYPPAHEVFDVVYCLNTIHDSNAQLREELDR